jgi:hypothetical protein
VKKKKPTNKQVANPSQAKQVPPPATNLKPTRSGHSCLPNPPKESRNNNARSSAASNKNPEINPNKNRYEVLYQGENVPSIEMLVKPSLNARITFEMSILE